MRGRRVRGHRHAWNWADSRTLSIVDGEVGTGFKSTADWLLPPARVDWLLESGRGRDSVTTSTILLWLDFVVSNPNSSGAAASMSPCDFWIIKEKADTPLTTTTTSFSYQPYDDPAPPAAVTSWESSGDDEIDGLDPFLWTHHIAPGTVPDLAGIYDTAGSTSHIGNVDYQLNPGTLWTHSHFVRPAWGPSVEIRTKRKMMRGEGLMIGFNTNTTGSGSTYALAYNVRLLTS